MQAVVLIGQGKKPCMRRSEVLFTAVQAGTALGRSIHGLQAGGKKVRCTVFGFIFTALLSFLGHRLTLGSIVMPPFCDQSIVIR